MSSCVSGSSICGLSQSSAEDLFTGWLACAWNPLQQLSASGHVRGGAALGRCRRRADTEHTAGRPCRLAQIGWLRRRAAPREHRAPAWHGSAQEAERSQGGASPRAGLAWHRPGGRQDSGRRLRPGRARGAQVYLALACMAASGRQQGVRAVAEAGPPARGGAGVPGAGGAGGGGRRRGGPRAGGRRGRAGRARARRQGQGAGPPRLP